MEEIYVYGQRLVECECGVWRLPDEVIDGKTYEMPCWNHQVRKQTMVEAIAQLSQSVRNFGYVLLKSLKLIK